MPGDDIARPYVMCRLPRRTRPFPALVDSGADGSSIPLWIAEALAVPYDPRHARIASGAGGEFSEHEAENDVVIDSEVGRITLARPGINAALPFILLGRRDFFKGRRVCFQQGTQRIEIVAD